jgi:hypothetical protein
VVYHRLASRTSYRDIGDAIYAKSAKEDLNDAEKHEIRRLVAALEAEA